MNEIFTHPSHSVCDSTRHTIPSLFIGTYYGVGWTVAQDLEIPMLTEFTHTTGKSPNHH